MENYFEDIEKKQLEKEQENLRIENFRPLSNSISRRNKLNNKPLFIIPKKRLIKKSVSSIFPSMEAKNNNNFNNNKDNNEFNSTNKTNSLNLTSLFNKDIKFTTLNENESTFNFFA